MRMIDAHIHYSEIESFYETARDLAKVDYTAAGLAAEFKRSGIIAGVGMGVTEVEPGGFPDDSSANPMELDLRGGLPESIFTCVGINPLTLQSDGQLSALENALQRDDVVGIKLYAGYYHFSVSDAVYDPVYELAAAYHLPVVIHGGLTYSDRGLLKYSHPLSMEEAIMKHRDINFMICHLGDPWVMDTAAMLEKNPNLYTDLSGWIVGDNAKVNRLMKEQTYTDHFRRAIVFAEKYDRLVFGTDWPLVPIHSYIRFVKNLIPDEHWELVFYHNALRLFPKLDQGLKRLGLI
ncbi:TatD family hydrolase [Paenibacillus sp. JX-17]|uniref:TatD family hydrolase n=1 Tax=Paenibacillus lacisoli TaxID=3064525 RepID=A0ABT9CFJ2_9BACL|nr:TatD family hydrolase [Paenibacillus sp. JX-17]MDO7908044.1 TatD family hydrolase [Paenibacillus sp. JX-17]